MKPVVYISYTRDSDQHLYEIDRLANRLESKGQIKVVLDLWEINDPEDWNEWVTQQIQRADFTLVVCSSIYHQKIMHNTDAGEGVPWNGGIMRRFLFDSSLEEQFIPILLSNGSEKHLVSSLKQQPVFSPNEGESFLKLYAYLLREYGRKKRTTSGPATSAPPKSTGLLDRLSKVIGSLVGSRSTTSAPPPSPRISLPKELSLDDFDFGEQSAGAEPPEEVGIEPEMAAPVEEEMEEMAPPDEEDDTITKGGPVPSPAAPSENPFQAGHILYAIPEHMTLSEPTLCRVRIAPESIAEEKLRERLTEKEAEAAKTEGLQVTSMMRVELEDARQKDNFIITHRNSPEQPILPFTFTEWGFEVTPKRPGHYALLLRVIAKLNVPGFGERPFDVATLDRAIQVTATATADEEEPFTTQTVPDPTWDEEDQRATEQALAAGRADKAIERLANFVQDKDEEFHHQLILLQGRWSDNTNQLQEGRIRAEDWDVVNNKVRFAVVQLMKKIQEAFPESGEDSGTIDWQKETETLKEIA